MEMSIGNISAPQDHCYVDHICVDSQFRGKGIGKALMDVADDQARQKGCHVGGLIILPVLYICVC